MRMPLYCRWGLHKRDIGTLDNAIKALAGKPYTMRCKRCYHAKRYRPRPVWEALKWITAFSLACIPLLWGAMRLAKYIALNIL